MNDTTNDEPCEHGALIDTALGLQMCTLCLALVEPDDVIEDLDDDTD